MALTTVKSNQIQSSVALAGSPTVATQSASDSSTKIATTAYVDTAVAAGPASITVNGNTMTGDGSDTTLTLAVAPSSENFTQVFIEGVYQPKSTYSVSGTTLTFSTAPPNSTAVEAITLSAATVSKNTMTGDNSDTTLTLAVAPSNENFTQVYIDGVYQPKSTYSVSGTTLTFSTAPPSSSAVEAITLSGSLDIAKDTMTGDGSDTTLTLSITPSSETFTQVYIDGVYQPKSTYSVSGTTLTFSTAPPNSTGVEVITISALTDGIPLTGSVTSAKIAADVALAGNPTTTTQTAGNSTTRIATTAFVGTAVSNLIDSSPAALNTLNELAAALNDDASFSTTITNSIATKLPLAGGTLTGTLAMGSNSITSTGIISSGAITSSASLKATDYRVNEGNSLAGGLFKEKNLTGSGSSNDLSIFAESISNGGNIHFMTGGSASIKATIDSSGNVGIRTSPETHYTGYAALDFGLTGTMYSATSGTNITSLINNAYLNSNASNWIYKAADEASYLAMMDGKFRFFTAGAGSAGGSINWGDDKMQLSAAGHLGIGTGNTAPRYNLQVKGNSTTAVGIALDNVNGSSTLDIAALGSGYANHQAAAGEVWFYSPDTINIGGATGNTNDIKFIANNKINMIIKGANGKVGVGINNPYAQFSVYYNQTDPYSAGSFLDYPTMELKHPSTTGGYNGIRYTNTAGNYEWFTGTEQTAGNAADYVFQGYDRGNATYREMARIHDDGNFQKPNQIYFEVYRSGNQTGYNAPNNYAHVVIYNGTTANIGGHYSTSTGFFTAPITGVYYFLATAYTAFTCGQAWFSNSGGGRLLGTDMVMNGMGQFPAAWTVIKLSANDTIGFHPYDSSTTNGTIYPNNNHTYFRGYFLG